jgi:single-stranded-DNA-specific exonuclease
LALATIGVIADLVPLRGGNRRLVRAGLAAMNGLPDGPVSRLLRGAGVAGALSASDIAFRIAPRINAAGRMDDPHVALDALLHGGDALEAIAACNTDRQVLQRSMTEDAVRAAHLQKDRPCVCIAGAYPHGIIGLLAGKITEVTGKPSLVCADDGVTCTGSLRSPLTCSIIDALRSAAAIMGTEAAGLRFGGHAHAAGCTLPTAMLPRLHDALCDAVAASTHPDDLLPACIADAAINLARTDIRFAQSLQSLEPFGQGNPELRFLAPHVRIDQPKRVGAEGKHLQGRISGHKMIGFGLGALADRCDAPLDILCRIGVDTWNGRSGMQVVVEDMRTSE